MQTKGEYTAGPWELCDEGDYGDYDGQCRVILGETEPDLPIRIAVVLTGGSDEMQAENNANARLIAAAPDLLEAVEGFINDLTDQKRNADNLLSIDHDKLVARIKLASAIIARAKGLPS